MTDVPSSPVLIESSTPREMQQLLNSVVPSPYLPELESSGTPVEILEERHLRQPEPRGYPRCTHTLIVMVKDLQGSRAIAHCYRMPDGRHAKLDPKYLRLADRIVKWGGAG